MSQTRWISVAPIAGGELGIFPFDGNDLAMLVLLPNDPDGLPQLEAQLTAEAIAEAVANAHPADEPAPVTLPKFTLTQKQVLSTLLQTRGIVSAFSASAADFSGIDGNRDLYVQDALHDATITVDERGAEGAAATDVTVVIKSAPPPFRADHSFDFAIYDNV